ncbi:acyl-CoA N-acyltransferase [Hypomontagnella submonticulosa]|nr:acyl-CoA N-acyltransferase [Hypomontagnella submonticulosa]
MADTTGTTDTTATTLPTRTAPIVTTDKCIIRPYAASDAEASAAGANHWEIVQFMRDTFPFPYTIDNANFWIDFTLKANPIVNFAITDLDGTFVGGIGLKPNVDVERRTNEVGYWIVPEHQGKGYATSALKGFIAWAFKEFPDLLRIEAGVFSTNIGSPKVLERAGFTLEGVRRKAVEKKGIVQDMFMYGLLRDEFEASSGSQ